MLSLAELAHSINGVWHGNAEYAILHYSSLIRATPTDVACFSHERFRPLLLDTKAGAVILKEEHKYLCPVNSISVFDPIRAMDEVMTLLSTKEAPRTGIDESARIHASARIGQSVHIEAHAVIAEDVVIEENVSIGANSYIGPSAHIGRGTKIGHGVILHPGCRIGSDCLIYSGCILGAIPFHYNKINGHWLQGPSVGGVILGNKVEIGANSVLDRGTLGDTYIESGVCIDNLVHIAHDAFVGKNTAIAASATLGAHVFIGSDCIIGGASTIAAHVQLADNIVITGMTTVHKSISKEGIYSSGTIVQEHKRWRRNAARFRRLDDYIVQFREN